MSVDLISDLRGYWDIESGIVGSPNLSTGDLGTAARYGGGTNVGGSPRGTDCMSQNGTTGYLAVGSNVTDWSAPVTTGFSVNCWARMTSNSTVNGAWVFNHRDNSNADMHWQLIFKTSTVSDFTVFNDGGTALTAIGSAV